MSEAKNKLVKSWLIKAQHDLSAPKSYQLEMTLFWIMRSIIVSKPQKKHSKASLFIMINELIRPMTFDL